MDGEEIRVIEGDCLAVMAGMPDGAVDCILTDPPYYRVARESWDAQWETPGDYLAWLGRVADEWRRLLRPNGSLYVFAAPRMAARVECLIAERFHVINSITWQKDFPCGALKYGPENFRGFVEMSERIVFAEHPEGVGATIRRARADAGLSAKELCAMTGAHGAVNHGGAVCNWELGLNLPTPDQYERMRARLGLPPYDDAVRPFSASMDRPYTDVWTFRPVPQSRLCHPCEKPLPLLSHILASSTRPDDLVLDCFAGSGSTLVACKKAGRRAIGIESDPRYIPVIHRRLAEAATPLFSSLAD